MGECELSVVIPSYFEEENLRVILPRLKDELEKLHIPYEVLVVDTMQPKDNTPSVCKKHGVGYVNREGGDKYGDAVRTGIKKAKGTYILFMDADGSHSPEFIPKLFEHRKDHDVVIASRYVAGGSTDNKRILILMSLACNITYSLVLGLDCKDVSNSFKLYRAEPLKRLAPRCDNFDIIEEILFKMKRQDKGLRIKEVPFHFKERLFGHTKRNLFLFVLSYLFTLLKLRFGT
jgi:dolichol-phosphate mannosyltransferase